jgi:hypothetical protein
VNLVEKFLKALEMGVTWDRLGARVSVVSRNDNGTLRRSPAKYTAAVQVSIVRIIF